MAETEQNQELKNKNKAEVIVDQKMESCLDSWMVETEQNQELKNKSIVEVNSWSNSYTPIAQLPLSELPRKLNAWNRAEPRLNLKTKRGTEAVNSWLNKHGKLH